MKKSSSLCLLLSLLLLHRKLVIAEGTDDGSEEWGYVEVRPKAQMFWWLYRSPQRAEFSNSPWPTILWLQGGPGASGAGIGNFLEIGPLDLNMKPRNLTWLQKADLLFVDNPVGTGFSYVEDERLVVRTDEEAATDLTTLLKEIFNKDKRLQTSPLFIVGESYGGKFAVTLGVSVLKAIRNRELKLTLGGVVLGDSWISPEDFVFSWGPLLKDVSRLDDNGLKDTNGQARVIKQQIEKGQYEDATVSWSSLEDVITGRSDAVDFYNFMLDSWRDPLSMVSMGFSKIISMKKYSSYLSSKGSLSADLSMIMNGAIREKLKIIPKNVVWGGQSDLVLSGLYKDFMKPRINEVDQLLSNGVNITIYNGQLDVICATKGAEAWVQKLKWGGLKTFTNLDRTPLYCRTVPHDTKGFTKSYKNLNFYWILLAGHFVPVDQPCVALQMIGEITHSPVHTS
ncbi:serine carboxypeptidase-like protein 51 [Cinnamomum micranthum f. kanehirae]|uniref:Carboxypeptidase n=1 Tax=Cinnamomum micranthum f. kanehirae TaxID=337451 RepID=A0A3S3PMC8_9MAGN|nr:serine carboxypeptidase-like protein 51 [Cinnamomum micranthum f. kanehirae]